MTTWNESMRVKWAGPVSEGTLLPEDLLPKFIFALEDLRDDLSKRPDWSQVKRDQVTYSIEQCLDRIHEERMTLGEDFWKSDNASWAMEETYGLLSSYAPDGLTFGSHEGDGACIGFWRE